MTSIAPAAAARRHIPTLLGKACIARRPIEGKVGETRICLEGLRGGYYCQACAARLKHQED